MARRKTSGRLEKDGTGNVRAGLRRGPRPFDSNRQPIHLDRVLNWALPISDHTMSSKKTKSDDLHGQDADRKRRLLEVVAGPGAIEAGTVDKVPVAMPAPFADAVRSPRHAVQVTRNGRSEFVGRGAADRYLNWTRSELDSVMDASHRRQLPDFRLVYVIRWGLCRAIWTEVRKGLEADEKEAIGRGKRLADARDAVVRTVDELVHAIADSRQAGDLPTKRFLKEVLDPFEAADTEAACMALVSSLASLNSEIFDVEYEPGYWPEPPPIVGGIAQALWCADPRAKRPGPKRSRSIVAFACKLAGLTPTQTAASVGLAHMDTKGRVSWGSAGRMYASSDPGLDDAAIRDWRNAMNKVRGGKGPGLLADEFARPIGEETLARWKEQWSGAADPTGDVD